MSARYRLFEGNRELAAGEHPLQRAARTGEPVPDFTGRLVRADGSSVEVVMSATPLLDEHGAPRGVIASVLDISGRERG